MATRLNDKYKEQIVPAMIAKVRIYIGNASSED